MEVVCETLTFITYREPCAVLYRFIMNDTIAGCPVYLVFSCIDEKMTSGLTQAIAEIEINAPVIIGGIASSCMITPRVRQQTLGYNVAKAASAYRK